MDKTAAPTEIQRVGVIGGGQLAWMMAPGAKALGLQLVVQTPSGDDPAVAIADHAIFAPVDDAKATAELAQHCDLITFENEFVDLAGLGQLAEQGTAFYPRITTLKPLLDKYSQRLYLQDLGLPSPPFMTLDSAADLPTKTAQVEAIGFPLVMKTRRWGYDGQGTFVIPDWASLSQTWADLQHPPVLIEAFVPFVKELAVMVARSPQGEIATYPVVETVQIDQVCRRVIAPAQVSPAVAATVTNLAQTLMAQAQIVGIFGLELFLTADNQVLINEVAPRTHNSGHYSLDVCATSQFEQQLRAVTGRPLGSTTMTYPQAVMVNLLGTTTAEGEAAQFMAQRQQLSQVPGATVYWYGKTAARPGRKLGHVTVCLETAEEEVGKAAIATLESLWYP
jgi:5-(carboxyamino)imidazole ribonucleotide synthase